MTAFMNSIQTLNTHGMPYTRRCVSMLVADRLYWFKRDCGHTCDTSTLDSAVAYLSRIIADTHRDIMQIGEPDDGYEQMVYDDLIDTHNRAVDILNVLIEGGLK